MDLFRKLKGWVGRKDAADVSPDLYLYKEEEQKPRVILITMLNVGENGIVEIIEKTTAKFSPHARVVYLTDSLGFMVFRERNAIFEYMPSLAEQLVHADTLDWPAYLKARWELLLTKWQPEQILAYGLNIDRFIANAARTGPADVR
jgi:hypothetical protein